MKTENNLVIYSTLCQNINTCITFARHTKPSPQYPHCKRATIETLFSIPAVMPFTTASNMLTVIFYALRKHRSRPATPYNS